MRASEAGTTGVPSFDELLGGGHASGDNIVWVTAGPADADAFADHFLGATPEGGLRRHVRLGPGSGPDLPPNTKVVDLSAGVDHASTADVQRAIVADDVDADTRLVVSGFDHLAAAWGTERALDLYTRSCPRLFDRGALAYWTGRRDLLGSALVDGITRIAQSVFELREGLLRVVKTEHRPTRLHGAVVEVTHVDGRPVVGREHVGGRIGEGLRRLRRERNLTQTDIAALARVTPAAISQAESGRRGLSLDTLVPLCERLGIGLDDLLGTARVADPLIARRERDLTAGTAALFDDPANGPTAYLVRLDPGEAGRPPFAHKGPELVFAVSGLVLVDLVDTTPVLRAGDALTATQTPIRRWTNLHPEPSELLWVTSRLAPTEPGTGAPDDVKATR